MQELFEQIDESVAAIRKVWSGKPHAGVILGTGNISLMLLIGISHRSSPMVIPSTGMVAEVS